LTGGMISVKECEYSGAAEVLPQIRVFPLFDPEDIEITSINEASDRIVIGVKSRTKSRKYPGCGCESNPYHSTYKRKICDLPIPGKSALLTVTAYK
jgi:transposase